VLAPAAVLPHNGHAATPSRHSTMQLTRFTDYSLRVLVYLAAHPERRCTVSEIATAYGVSANHLTKVVNRLANAGYAETLRGKGGGIRLARAPQLINIGAVVRAMEERFDIVECFSGEHQDCPLLPACALKSLLVDAQHGFLATLDRVTLAQIVGSAGRVAAALEKAVRIGPRSAPGYALSR
jgi:Rrf2 family nitric oxide-sensitive transcriptional repressor